jgi:hypothetical protein
MTVVSTCHDSFGFVARMPTLGCSGSPATRLKSRPGEAWSIRDPGH